MHTPIKKKILYLITKSNWGGAQRYVFDVATNLPKDRFDVVVAFGGHGRLEEKLHEASIRTRTIDSFERDINLIKEARAMFELWNIIREERPDIMHVNSSKAGGSGAFVARLLGVPRIIFTAHGWPFLERRSFMWRAVVLFFSWFTAILAHAVIVVSDYDLSVARRMPFVARKAIRIHNGIDLNMALGSGEVIRNAFPPQTKITGTIGELTRNKNHISLIEEAQRTENMSVAIVGEGEERNRLEQMIQTAGLKHRVRLFGFLPASEVLKGFDEFVLPSLKEGLPYVLIEARVAGLPIRANRVGGIPDILDASDMSDFSLEKMLEKTLAVYHP